jgi:transcriptional regulator with XRE-family HTH domain
VPREPADASRRKLTALLRDARQAAGLRQADVAARLDQPQSYVSKYESGERRLDVIELQAILDVLGVSLVDFSRRLEEET